jgi:ATP-dependent DNA helicase RecQ
MASFPVPICRWSFALASTLLILCRRLCAFADDPAWDDELAALGQRDGPALPLIKEGSWTCCAVWSRSGERPVAVVGMPSRRHPTLVRSVAEHIAAVGRLPLVHELKISGPPPAVDAASTVRAKDLLYRTVLASG